MQIDLNELKKDKSDLSAHHEPIVPIGVPDKILVDHLSLSASERPIAPASAVQLPIRC